MTNLTRYLISGFGVLLIVLWVISSLYISKKSLPNIYLGELSLGSKTRNEVASAVSQYFKNYESQNLIFEVGDYRVNSDLKTLGVSYRQEAVVNAVFLAGRSGKFWEDLKIKIRSIFGKNRIDPILGVDFGKLSLFVEQNVARDEQKPIEATVAFDNGRIRTIEETDGLVINRQKLYADIRNRLDSLSTEPITVEKIKAAPRVRGNQAKKAFEKLQTMTSQRLVLNFGYDNWVFAGNNLFNLLTIAPLGLEKGYLLKVNLVSPALTINWISIANDSPADLNVTPNEEKINETIDEMAKRIDQPTVDATLKFEGGKIVEFTPARDGQELDIEKTKQLIAEEVSVDNLSGSRDLVISLPVEITRAKIANEEINSFGIRELVGRGVSYFAGSIANRIHNISLGASRTNGLLLKPGEEFSFNRAVGEVSEATGYRKAYVISSGRTILDDGGGICQVSTTVFRAALNAGLPVISRTAHAYRVGYYEQRGFKPGFDATVWAPAVDLVFKNDTSNHLLVQIIVDRANSKLQVDLYGTGDGRVVEISDPVISNRKPALPDLHQDDPTLPRGTIKQVDFAAEGASAIFARKVKKNDKVIIDESFKSVYRPWQAIYLVGTGG